MNWEAVGAVGEVLGAVAVVLTLAYLTAQIRIGNKALRTSMREAALDTLRQWSHVVMSDAALASVVERGAKSYSDLSPTEQVQFGHCFYSFFKGFENIYIQYLDGVVSTDVWEGNSRALYLYGNQPGVLSWLERGSYLLDPRFVKMMEAEDPRELHDGTKPLHADQTRGSSA